MHIPDSVISPATSAATGAVMLPIWYGALRVLRRTLTTRQVPLLALGAAFAFTIMMFNIPVVGGTTVHAVGGVALAIALGPWAAVMGVSVALGIQALFFGDGGILAFGANCLTMACAMPLTGYAIYRLASSGGQCTPARRAFAVGLGAYVGANVAALSTAVLLGIQPWLYHDHLGRALYFPFDLRVTVPAMMIPHLTIAGFAEAVVTVIAVRYAQAAGVPIAGLIEREEKASRVQWLWLALAALVALSPLGLLATGEAWGEWGREELEKRAGYVPPKLAEMEERPVATPPLPDYLSDRGPAFYVISGLVGAAVVAGLVLIVGRLLARRQHDSDGSDTEGPPPTSTVREGELPDWLCSDDASAEERPRAGPTTQVRGFAERTLHHLVHSMAEQLAAERTARHRGLLQSLDPRTKVLCALAAVLCISLTHSLPALAAAWLSVAGLGRLSGISPRTLVVRVWWIAVVFAGVVALPAALRVSTPGPTLLAFGASPWLTLTTPGVWVALRIVVRVAAALSVAHLVALTTPWASLLAALRGLGLPSIVVAVLGMTYRYLAVMIQAADDAFSARVSRMVGAVEGSRGRLLVGSAMGALLARSLALVEEVHDSMLSRGWTGQARSLTRFRFRAQDLAFSSVVALLLACLLWTTRVGGP